MKRIHIYCDKEKDDYQLVGRHTPFLGLIIVAMVFFQ
jgi:hypothetical protein